MKKKFLLLLALIQESINYHYSLDFYGIAICSYSYLIIAVTFVGMESRKSSRTSLIQIYWTKDSEISEKLVQVKQPKVY